MIDELNTAIDRYYEKWRTQVTASQHRHVFERLQSVSVGWKVEDTAEFDRRFHELRDHADQIHLAWINERWVASIHLRDTTLSNGLSIVKLMQRRPGSRDTIGLDHLDFLIPGDIDMKALLQQETGLNWTEESNGKHAVWLSVWFANTEAKLRYRTVLDVGMSEMSEIRDRIISGNDET